jgi:hypothetical protein
MEPGILSSQTSIEILMSVCMYAIRVAMTLCHVRACRVDYPFSRKYKPTTAFLPGSFSIFHQKGCAITEYMSEVKCKIS